MNTKICNKCGIAKSIDNFEYRKDKNSYRNTCKSCRNEERRKKYNADKDKINEKRREKYNENKDKINETRRNKRNQLTPTQKLKRQVYNAICNSYERKGFIRTKSVEEILGRSLDEVVEHLIKNYEHRYKKKYDATEKVCVDHIIPIWTAKTVEELDKCNRCLQLLSEKENHRKGGKMSNEIGKNGKVKYERFDPEWFD